MRFDIGECVLMGLLTAARRGSRAAGKIGRLLAVARTRNTLMVWLPSRRYAASGEARGQRAICEDERRRSRAFDDLIHGHHSVTSDVESVARCPSMALASTPTIKKTFAPNWFEHSLLHVSRLVT